MTAEDIQDFGVPSFHEDHHEHMSQLFKALNKGNHDLFWGGERVIRGKKAISKFTTREYLLFRDYDTCPGMIVDHEFSF